MKQKKIYLLFSMAMLINLCGGSYSAQQGKRNSPLIQHKYAENGTIDASELGSETLSNIYDKDGIDSGSTYIIGKVCSNKYTSVDETKYPFQDRALRIDDGGNINQWLINGDGTGNTVVKEWDGKADFPNHYYWQILKTNEGFSIQSLLNKRYLSINLQNRSLELSNTPCYFEIFLNENGYYNIRKGDLYLYHHLDPAKPFTISTEPDDIKLYKKVLIKTSSTPKGTSSSAFEKSQINTFFKNPSSISLDDGTIIATADAVGNNVNSNSMNIDTLISSSKDNGENWSWDVVNNYKDYASDSSDINSASYANVSLTAVSNSMYMAFNMIPAGSKDVANNINSNGFDTNGNLILYFDNSISPENNQAPTDVSQYTWHIDSGTETKSVLGRSLSLHRIKNASNASQKYLVDGSFNLFIEDGGSVLPLATKQIGQTEKYVQSNVFYKSSPVKPYPTNYVGIKSSDMVNGASNWSDVKLFSLSSANSETDLTVASGKGIFQKDKMFFPVYSPSGKYVSLVKYDLASGTATRCASSNTLAGDIESVSAIELPNGNIRLYYSVNSGISFVDYDVTSNSFSASTNANITAAKGFSIININGTLINKTNETSYANVVMASYAEGGKTLVRFANISNDASETTWLNNNGLTEEFGNSSVTQISNCSSDFIAFYEDANDNVSTKKFNVNDILGSNWELCPVGSIEKHSLTPEGDIGVNFYVRLTKYAIDRKESIRLRFTYNGQTTNEYLSKIVDDLYCFTVKVDSTQMAEDVKVQFVLNSYTSSVIENYSVNAYHEAAKALNDEKLTNLTDAMTRYGRYSKNYFENGSLAADDVLANADYSGLAAYKPTKTVNGEEDQIIYKGTTLFLDSSTKMRHYFDVKYADASITKASNVQYSELKKLYYVEIDNISANNLSKTYSTTINKTTINYSALSYAYLASKSNDENMVNVAKALYLYSVAADAYYTE